MQLTVAGIVLSSPLFDSKVYKCLRILLSLFWQMPPWDQVAHATVILSGIVSYYAISHVSSR